MISMGFVEQPGSASTRHHQTVNRTRATAALPSVIGRQGRISPGIGCSGTSAYDGPYALIQPFGQLGGSVPQ
jgi:hypothetical protein